MTSNYKPINTDDERSRFFMESFFIFFMGEEKGENFYFFTWYELEKKYWYNTKAFDMCYNIKAGIRNYWRWRKVIWDDRDWDGEYILRILKAKIDFHRETLVKNKIVADIDEIDEHMKYVSDRLGKVADDRYELGDMVNDKAQSDLNEAMKVFTEQVLTWWD